MSRVGLRAVLNTASKVGADRLLTRAVLKRNHDREGVDAQAFTRLCLVGLAMAVAAMAQEAPVPPEPRVPPQAPEIEYAFELHEELFNHAEFALEAPPFPPAPVLEPFEWAMLMPQEPPKPPTAPHPPADARKWEHRRFSERDAEDSLYRAGTRHLDRREYGPALEAFTAAAGKKGAKADGSLYWKAYALAKLGRRDEALATLNELEKSYAGSRWLNDAKALAVEVRQAGGQAVSPETESDDDVKLIALNSIVQSDPDRALPVLEKILSRGGSPRFKEQALFVLAQSRTPQARDLVIQLAKGKGNPDLQYKAVEFLAMQRSSNTAPILAEIYGSSNDVNLKQRILNSFMALRDTDRLLNAAKNETNPDLRRTAVQLVAALGRSTQTSDALFSLYNSESDPRIKREILDGLFQQQSIPRLIEIARKETNPDLRREAVRRLSMSKSKEANDFMIEILNK